MNELDEFLMMHTKKEDMLETCARCCPRYYRTLKAMEQKEKEKEKEKKENWKEKGKIIDDKGDNVNQDEHEDDTDVQVENKIDEKEPDDEKIALCSICKVYDEHKKNTDLLMSKMIKNDPYFIDKQVVVTEKEWNKCYESAINEFDKSLNNVLIELTNVFSNKLNVIVCKDIDHINTSLWHMILTFMCEKHDLIIQFYDLLDLFNLKSTWNCNLGLVLLENLFHLSFRMLNQNNENFNKNMNAITKQRQLIGHYGGQGNEHDGKFEFTLQTIHQQYAPVCTVFHDKKENYHFNHLVQLKKEHYESLFKTKDTDNNFVSKTIHRSFAGYDHMFWDDNKPTYSSNNPSLNLSFEDIVKKQLENGNDKQFICNKYLSMYLKLLLIYVEKYGTKVFKLREFSYEGHEYYPRGPPQLQRTHTYYLVNGSGITDSTNDNDILFGICTSQGHSIGV